MRKGAGFYTLLWKSSSKLGVGVAEYSTGLYIKYIVVCDYDPLETGEENLRKIYQEYQVDYINLLYETWTSNPNRYVNVSKI